MGKGVFFTSASILLAVILTTTLRHHHHHHHPPSLNYTPTASKLLRSHGFNFIANFLHISPELFSQTPQITIFAVPDSAISNLSIPPHMIKHLLAYHILPTKLTMQQLLNKPLKTCLPTLFQHQTVSITKTDYKKQVLEINNVLLTHPDLFLDQFVTMHGVSGSFASFDRHQERINLGFCEAGITRGFVNIKHEWEKMIRVLVSSGFMAFAIGLKSVTDGIVKDFPDIDSVTVFTPPNVALNAMSSPLLDRFMRVHVVVKRYSFKELVLGGSLSTLAPGKHLDVTESLKSSDQVVCVNGVAITAPDLFVSKSLVVHGIARPLSIDELSSMSG
ncbi:fasciclin-like arabinogalactan protein 21 [Bidens hawaiensis]|uniref:fasciclin-like arabinogalactan protein 21 n=1 Tax=Bidens hawaiensis TaxID=980011 RepID=UPI004048EB5C